MSYETVYVKPQRRWGQQPYIWCTWVAKLLGGDACYWSAWFKAHFRYTKYEAMAGDLTRWNKEHTALMKARRFELEAAGWLVFWEDENAFKISVAGAVVAGKADIVAKKVEAGVAKWKILDGKTGRERESDAWQVIIYLKAKMVLTGTLPADLLAEVHYKTDQVLTITADGVEESWPAVEDAVKVIAATDAPPKTPSKHECQRCNIGARDCGMRYTEANSSMAEG